MPLAMYNFHAHGTYIQKQATIIMQYNKRLE